MTIQLGTCDADDRTAIELLKTGGLFYEAGFYAYWADAGDGYGAHPSSQQYVSAITGEKLFLQGFEDAMKQDLAAWSGVERTLITVNNLTGKAVEKSDA